MYPRDGVAHASTKTASVDIVSTLSSSSCEDAETSTQWSCNISVVKGSAVVVLLGCLSVTTDCSGDQALVGDSEADSYAGISSVFTPCSSEGCNEYAFWTSPTITGVDSITFKVSEKEFFAADIFDLTGVNSSVAPTHFGFGSVSGGVPGGSLTSLEPFTGGIVLAGVVADSVQKFLAGADYAMIPGQPCPQGCDGTLGDWQAAEYSNPASGSSLPVAFNYPSTNGGWQELAVSFAPVRASTTISCAGSFVAAGGSKCTATVTGDGPNGTVSWSANSTGTFSPTTCTVSSGQCDVLFTPSSAAAVNVTARYGGDASNPLTAGSAVLKVEKATPHVGVVCGPSPVPTGSETTCTATVTGASPAGTITWASSGVARLLARRHLHPLGGGLRRRLRALPLLHPDSRHRGLLGRREQQGELGNLPALDRAGSELILHLRKHHLFDHRFHAHDLFRLAIVGFDDELSLSDNDSKPADEHRRVLFLRASAFISGGRHRHTSRHTRRACRAPCQNAE